ncbi:MAG: DsbC family protein [Limnobacter sp.]|nr:DsbC family protein [Limnobacter sp.]
MKYERSFSGLLQFGLVALMVFFLMQHTLAHASAEQDISQRVNRILDGSGTVESVTKLPYFDDLYEVVVQEPGSKRILYSNRSGSHVLLGSLVDSRTMSNLTSERITKLNRIDFEKDLKPELALKTVHGTGQRKVAVFEDPRCTYCKKLRQTAIETLQDATVYTYVYPILGPTSIGMAGMVLCAQNPSKMWNAWMLDNVTPQGDVDCSPPIQQLVDLGASLGITSTPTIIFEDGTRTSGAIKPSEFHRRVTQAERR